jgi:cell division protein FtsL
MEFQEKKRIRRKLYSKTSLVVVIAVLVLLARSTLNIIQKYYVTAKNLKEAEANLYENKERKSHLENEKLELESGLGVEREMLNRFDLVREGENVAVIISQPESESEVIPEKKSLLGKVAGFFSGFFASD